jgi:Ca2+-binding EF-hand superfamily protein
MTRRNRRITDFDTRSLMLIASLTLGAAGSALAQSAATPATATDKAIGAAFTKADRNADGKLSREEAATLPAVSANFEKVDTDKDGAVNLAEFDKAMKM